MTNAEQEEILSISLNEGLTTDDHKEHELFKANEYNSIFFMQRVAAAMSNSAYCYKFIKTIVKAYEEAMASVANN